ncbi:MAG: gliding motility lipoprotein GldH [Bacteroidia bacterium]|nr:gliding motility lipoprotein GldH [Bacteroidia bacterium]MCZ2278282.1 gliding motility lipoprotein GldH [Bacteroidia bacterium]
MRFNIITLSFLLVVGGLMLIISCDPSRVYEKNEKIADNSWKINSPLTFKVDITDTITTHDIYINVRNAGYYGFSNLYLFIDSWLPDGKHSRDTLECILASPDGRWLGDGLGDIWDNKILFRKKIVFPMSGTYRFQLTQAMRVNPLPGIMDAGIRIEKSQKAT